VPSVFNCQASHGPNSRRTTTEKSATERIDTERRRQSRAIHMARERGGMKKSIGGWDVRPSHIADAAEVTGWHDPVECFFFIG